MNEPQAQSLEKAFRTAVPSQLLSALDETPGLIVPVIAVFAALEVFGFRRLFPSDPGPVATYSLEALIATLLGVILYSAGNFWDDQIFDKLYGVKNRTGKGGLWLGKERRVWGVFPAGKPLQNHREWAAKALHGCEEKLTGIYTNAESIVRNTNAWKDVEAPLVISKLARSFIWPSIGIGTVSILNALIQFLSQTENGSFFRSFGIACIVTAILSVIPYLDFRVRHMEKLYRAAVDIKERSSSTEQDAALSN